MIQLENVNKYFNRRKKNEIHVIDNTSLNFENSGLVALLGPSGCGKTTLLNAIGGLDKINSGRIYINGIKMPRCGSYKKDKIRVLNIGYIFQDYNLLDNMSVFDNVAISLRMIGVKNRFEIKKRVNYVLEAVGMYRYRNKPAGALSGGQRQRVGIARALVKNPEVIIADEPTGNLDSKNTIEIMNIIKAISKNKLVILVTHEKDLAHFYASRIVNIEDGKVISDEVNEHENELDYKIDNKIYLRDFKNISNIDSHNINVYSDKKEKLNLDIVIKNGNIYIKSNDGNKIEVVDQESGIEFIDDNYKKISKKDYEKNSFDLSVLENSKYKLHYASIYNVYSMLKAGFNKVLNYPIMKKILLIGFFVSAMFIVFAVSGIFGVTKIDESNFLNVNRNYIKIDNNKNDLEEYLEIEKLDNISYVMPGSSVISMTIVYDKLYQLQDANVMLSASLASSSILKSEDIIYGRMPTDKQEIVLDIFSIKSAIDSNDEIGMLNIQEEQDFLDVKLKIGNDEFIVVGISDSKSPCVYISEEHFIDVIANSADYEYKDVIVENEETTSIKNFENAKNDITIKKGRAPINDYEVIVNIDNQYAMPLNKTIDMKVGEEKLKVVGYYTSSIGANEYYVSANTYKYNTILTNPGMTIYALDQHGTIDELQTMGYNAMDVYTYSRESYLNEAREGIMQLLIISGILLAISFVEIFLMIRASFMSRIKEVGIYRAIGVKKSDIYKMFLGEILVITTLTGLPGAILMGSIMKEVLKIPFLTTFYAMDARVMVVSIVIIYVLNIVVGLLPIRNVIRHTPHEILSRNDVD